MAWSFFTFSQIIHDDERGVLTRNGRFEKLLEPGLFRAFDPGRALAVEVFKVVRAELPVERALLLQKARPELAAMFEIVRVGPSEVAIVSLDREPRSPLGPNTVRAYWKAVTEISVERVNVAADLRVAKRHLDMIDPDKTLLVASALVEPHETALLVVDGEVKERLAPGKYAFWNVTRTIRIAKVDLRPTPLEVTAQEILTKDRIGIRVTLTAFYRIVDPEKSVLASADLPNTIYRLIQFAIREAVAARTSVSILSRRWARRSAKSASRT